MVEGGDKEERRLQLRQVMAQVGRQMLEEYMTFANNIPHLQQRGEGRENILREFLNVARAHAAREVSKSVKK